MSNTVYQNKKLRFAVMCNGHELKSWQHESIKHVVDTGRAELVLIIIDKLANRERKPQKSRFLKKRGLYLLFDRFLLKTPVNKTVDSFSLFKNADVMFCTTINKNKIVQYFEDDDINKIKHLNLDFILRFGFGIIKGDILTVAKYGVWSFHHGDEEKFRGGPPGLWEILFGHNATGCILQKLTEKLDAGVVLRKGYIKTTKHSYKEQLQRLLITFTHYPAQVCIDITENKAEYFHQPASPTKAKIYKAPDNFSFLLIQIVLLVNRVFLHFKKLLFHEYWRIGIIEQPIQDITDESFTKPVNVKGFKAPKGKTYRADPFGFVLDNGKQFILYEKYDYKTKMGQIYMADPKEIQNEKPAFPKKEHQSYPYIFRDNDSIYCIPETAKSGKTSLYKFDNESYQFSYLKEILPNVGLIDPTIVHYDGLYWMFGTLAKTGSNQSLYVYYSDDILGNWLPHAQNPVKTDVFSSRPAGTPFWDGNKLYRPAQDSSKTYGWKISLCEILVLNKYVFREKVVDKISSPIWHRGMHTISSFGNRCLIDMKRYKFRLFF